MKSGIAYFGVRNPEWVREDMRRLKAAGYTHVLHTWSEEDLQYSPDTLQEIISLSVEEGLKVYVNPWGIGRVFGGEAYSELAARDASLAQVAPDGTRLVAACPNQPGFQAFMLRWIERVCATQVETIFWDEPHFYFEKGKPDLWACRCEVCQRLYQERTGQAMPSQITPAVEAFRQASLVEFLSRMTAEVHRFGKRNSVCLLPPWFPAGLDDWDSVASLPHVDEIGSDPYWEKGHSWEKVESSYTEVSTRIVELAKRHGREAQMWIKNYHIEDGTEYHVVLATEAAARAGVRNIFAWSYLGSSYMSWLRSAHPLRVWDMQTTALRRLHEQFPD